MNGLKIGQFIQGDSLIHRMDPRIKLLLVLYITGSILLHQKIPLILADGLVVAVGYGLAGIPLGQVGRTLGRIKYLLCFAFLTQAFLQPGAPIPLVLGLQVTREGVDLGVLTVFRMVILFLASALLTMTTSPLRLTAGLESLLSPLGRVGFPVRPFSVMIGTALRFIPTLVEEAETLYRAQSSRGAPFHSRRLTLRVASLLTLLIPMLAASLQRAEELAMAMESRCYMDDAGKAAPVHAQPLPLHEAGAAGLIGGMILWLQIIW